MKIKILVIVTFVVALCGCDNYEKKQNVNKSGTFQENNTSIPNAHRKREFQYYPTNMFRPMDGETIEEANERNFGSYRNRNDSYEDGYEAGYEDAKKGRASEY